MAQRGYRRGGAALGAPGREQPAAVAALCSSTKDESVAVRSRKGQPNKRLKLAGGDRPKGSGVLCPYARQLTLNIMAPCGPVARSLSAIR